VAEAPQAPPPPRAYLEDLEFREQNLAPDPPRERPPAKKAQAKKQAAKKQAAQETPAEDQPAKAKPQTAATPKVTKRSRNQKKRR
jgi:hypothetical protein